MAEKTSGSTSIASSLLHSIEQRLQQVEDENKVLRSEISTVADVRTEVAHLRTENEVLRSEISKVANESTASQVSSWVTLQQALQQENALESEPLTRARTSVATAVGAAASFLKQRRMTTEVSRSGGLTWHANSACVFTQLPDTIVFMVIAFVDVERGVHGLACAGVAFGWPQPSQKNKTLASFASPTILGPVKVKGVRGAMAPSVNGVYTWMDSAKLGGPGLRNVSDPDFDFRQSQMFDWDPDSFYWQVTRFKKVLLSSIAYNGRVRDPTGWELGDNWECHSDDDGDDDDDGLRHIEVFWHVPPVIVSGAIGPNAANINGVYLPTNENCHGIERLQKQDQSGSYIQFSGKATTKDVPGGYKWVIGSQADAAAGSRSGLDGCWAYCLQTRLSDPVKAQTWHVNCCGVQPSMKVDRWVVPLPHSFPLQITGAQGLHAAQIIGTDVPTGKLYNGKMLFKKNASKYYKKARSEDDDVWLRFAAAGGHNVWAISSNADTKENRSCETTELTPCYCFCEDKNLVDPSEASRWKKKEYGENFSMPTFRSSPGIKVKRAAS